MKATWVRISEYSGLLGFVEIVNERIECYSDPKKGRLRKMGEFEKGDHSVLLDHIV
ncbi:MAG: hypothetical protein AAF620_10910 [Bacteroidota bacterium]